MRARKRKARPAERWDPLREITAECSDQFLEDLAAREGRELIGVWQSSLYEVYAFRFEVPGWPGGEVTWLSIKRRRKDHVRDWRHLQRIKTEVCGPDREAVELFPAESRHVDTSNQYHCGSWRRGTGSRSDTTAAPWSRSGPGTTSTSPDPPASGRSSPGWSPRTPCPRRRPRGSSRPGMNEVPELLRPAGRDARTGGPEVPDLRGGGTAGNSTPRTASRSCARTSTGSTGRGGFRLT